MVKKIGYSLLSLFLIYLSYQLLGNVQATKTDLWGVTFFNGWIINMYITGIFAFAGFVFPTQKLLPQSYYTIYQPQKLKKAYNLLKVDVFRKLLLATFWKNKEQRKKYFNGKVDGISTLEKQSMKSEFGHLIPFILLNMISLYLVSVDLTKLSLTCFLFNIIGNFYPIILQRHHRMRIQLIRQRHERRIARRL